MERQSVPQRSPPFSGRSSKPASFIFCPARRSSRQTNALASLDTNRPLALLSLHLGILGSSERIGGRTQDGRPASRGRIGVREGGYWLCVRLAFLGLLALVNPPHRYYQP